MAWEIFTGKGIHCGGLRVSISPNGRLSISAECVRRFDPKCKFAEVFWDSEIKTFAIKPLENKTNDALKLTITGHGAYSMSFTGPLKWAGYELPRETTREDVEINADGWLTFKVGTAK